LPIFALVFVGWAFRKLNILGANATIELNRFVVYLALPALLFDIVVHAHAADIWQPGFVTAFGLSCLLIFAITVSISLYRRRGGANAAIDGLNAAYPNTGFMGFPLALALLGETALPEALIASIITVCVLFGIAIVMIEIAKQRDQNVWKLLSGVLLSLLKNPLILAPVAGTMVAMTTSGIPAPAEVFLKLLSSAASPCALIALGLFIAEERKAEASNLRIVLLLAVAKLVLQPAIAVAIAIALRLPAETTTAVLLLAALPTGTGPFMLAEIHRCDASVTARTILVTTFISIFTIAIYLHVGAGLLH
jgi:malonate transporter and related proteins